MVVPGTGLTGQVDHHSLARGAVRRQCADAVVDLDSGSASDGL